MKPLDGVFAALAKSAFRRRFRLQDRERAYLQEKSMQVVLEHARDFIEQRLAPAAPRVARFTRTPAGLIRIAA